MPAASAIASTTRAGSATADAVTCRLCGATARDLVVDLGMSPLCESYVTADRLNAMEPFYPLRVFVCRECFLAQLEAYVSPTEIFAEYAYFSSYSDSWLAHARRYVEQMVEQLGLDGSSRVIEVASNDGYLLQYFVARGIPVLGIEPAANVARAALARGVPTMTGFFGRKLAEVLVEGGRRADLLVGNNVLAQVPDLNDFIAGLKMVLGDRGVLTLEFPHLMRLIEGNQFDTIYHEHFSYFSLHAAEQALGRHALRVFDVEELPTHGGSLRLYACHLEDASKRETARLAALRAGEQRAGVRDLASYGTFGERVKATKRRLLQFLNEVKDRGRSIAGYGAPGKGNTLLNYCGIRTDYLDYTVDRNPYKQGRYTPGTHIPICAPERIDETRPDYVLILPWNVKDEIIAQMAHIRSWGGRFIVPIPQLAIVE